MDDVQQSPPIGSHTHDEFARIYELVADTIAVAYFVNKKGKSGSGGIKAKGRGTPRESEARHVAWWCYKQLTGDSFYHMATLMDRRHSSIMHGYEVIEIRRRQDWLYDRKLARLMEKLGERLIEGINSLPDPEPDEPEAELLENL